MVVRRLTPKALSGVVADNPYRVMRPTVGSSAQGTVVREQARSYKERSGAVGYL